MVRFRFQPITVHQQTQRAAWPRANTWLKFRVNGKGLRDVACLQDRSISDDEFLERSELLYIKLDALAAEVIRHLASSNQVSAETKHALEAALTVLDEEWEEIGIPSPQYSVLERLIAKYLWLVGGVIRWSVPAHDLPEVRRIRWLKQDVDYTLGCLKAYWPLRDILQRK